MNHGYEEPSFDPYGDAIDGRGAHRADAFADDPEVKRMDDQNKKTEELRNRLGRSVTTQALRDPSTHIRNRSELRKPR